MEWPKVQVSSTKAHTEYKFIGGSWLPIAMCSTMAAAIFLPYIIVLCRGTLDPFLPFVSQVAGSPPQSGLFNLLVIVSSLLAFVGLNLMYMGIRIQKKRLEDESIRHTVSFLSKLALVPGHLGIAGMIIVGSYPIDFYRNTEQWMHVTIIPHLIGALSVFLGGLFFCIVITYVMSLLHPEQKQMLRIRILLVCLITMCSALQGYTVRDGFMTDEEPIISCVVESHHISYNFSYLISSVCEWLLVLAFIVFFLTLKDEAKDFCFTMNITLREYSSTTSEVKDAKEEILPSDSAQSPN